MPTETARHTQTVPVSVLGCLGLDLCLRWRLLSSVGISFSLEMSGGCPGDIWVVFIGIRGAQMCWGGGIWVLTRFLTLAVWSRNTILNDWVI